MPKSTTAIFGAWLKDRVAHQWKLMVRSTQRRFSLLIPNESSPLTLNGFDFATVHSDRCSRHPLRSRADHESEKFSNLLWLPVTADAGFLRPVGHSGRSAFSVASAGGLRSSTIMVMMTLNTLSENAAKRSGVVFLFAIAPRRLRLAHRLG